MRATCNGLVDIYTPTVLHIWLYTLNHVTVESSYETESWGKGKKLHRLLWDRYSFVLHVQTVAIASTSPPRPTDRPLSTAEPPRSLGKIRRTHARPIHFPVYIFIYPTHTPQISEFCGTLGGLDSKIFVK
jgi:hypothetical protein